MIGEASRGNALKDLSERHEPEVPGRELNIPRWNFGLKSMRHCSIVSAAGRQLLRNV
jgi:hypothetical protein